MKFIFYIYFLIAATQTFAQDCSTLIPASSVDVKVIFERPTNYFNLGWKEITKRAAPSVEGVGKDTKVFGLTEIEIKTSFKTSLWVFPSGVGDIFCARIAMKVEFIAATPYVFIARELPSNACGLKEVFDHEYRHVALQKNMLNKLADEVQREMGQFYGGKYFNGDREQLTNRFAKEISEYWKPRWEARLNSFAFYHSQEIDTLEEERRMGRVCDSILSKIIDETK